MDSRLLVQLVAWLSLGNEVLSSDAIRRQVWIPLDYPSGSPLVHLPGPDFILAPQTKVLHSKSSNQPSSALNLSHLFAIQGNQLVLLSSLANISQEDLGREVELTSSSLPSQRVKVRPVTDASQLCSSATRTCFYGGPRVNYPLSVSFPTMTVFDVIAPPPSALVCGNDVTIRYSMLGNDSDWVEVDPDTGSLWLSGPLDSNRSELNFQVLCSAQMGINGTSAEVILGASIQVLPAAIGQISNHTQYLTLAASSPHLDLDLADLQQGRPLTDQFNVFYWGPPELQNVTERLEDDHLGLFRVEIGNVMPGAPNGAILIHALVTPVKKVDFYGPSYKFKVVFEDQALTNLGKHAKTVFHVHIHKTSPELPYSGQEFYFSLSRCATRYARVGNLSFVSANQVGFNFKAVYLSPKPGRILRVTPRTGLLYLDDPSGLKTSSETSLQINVTWSNQQISGHYLINVTWLDGKESCISERPGQSCALQSLRSSCESSVGSGTPSGHCLWRESGGKDGLSSSGYATCSPSFETCPNGRCDELEAKDPKRICPQDCYNEWLGQARAEEGGVGIHLGRGTCFCSPDDCRCHSHVEPPSRRTEDHPNRTDNTSNGTTPVMLVPVEAAPPTCDTTCLLLVIFIPGSLLLAFFAIVTHKRRGSRHRRRRKKQSAGCISLSVVPSEYVDERRVSAPVIATGLLLQQSTDPTSTVRKNSVDPKWEFPRDKVLIEEVLGEGEFGRVVKARAWAIKGQPGWTPVAVKMLKGNCNSSDRDDLLSELSLLKEVDHPNVIRLMGACTMKDGPLLVIVELAELGSLRTYLRHCRRLDLDRTCHTWTVENPSYITEASLTVRDLLSFAWQIARGMSYLSEMKVVHRDLAARNILLAAGKVIKISDFGLSRDVYEGDTYLKRSKGRVPVKWMALESLQDHVYTTKSDVWSFGIVLWEIVTLGSSPYPGVTPERLYQLLRAGYRMERPEACREDLYLLMRQCWRAGPTSRPSFKVLSQRLDSLLQDTATYLDLSSLATQQDFVDEDESVDPGTLLNYSCLFDDGQLEYGNICPLLSESPEPSIQEI